MLEKVIKNEYGFYELKQKPTAEEQKHNFEEEYFQQEQGSYEASYEQEELIFFENKIAQKEVAWQRVINMQEKREILDIGCGEGFLLKYFYKKGHTVLGIDFSRYGVEHNNPEVLPYLLQGDCYEEIEKLIEKGKKFDVVNMDATLDMVQRPGQLLELIKKLLKPEGIVSCKVANNYSAFQMRLLENGTLTKEYWLDEKGHSWYFNKDGFKVFFDKYGYTCLDIYAEGLIELNLLNELTNYYEVPQTGKACYRGKIRTENLLHEISPEKTNEIMRLFGDMGLGRELVGIFRIKD